MIRIDDALNQLTRHDPQKARLLEMRFFGGLTAEESAAMRALPINVIRRDLRVAEAWLQHELNPGRDRTGGGASERPTPGASRRQCHD